MKKWYQVEIPGVKAFGFSISDGIIIDHPSREWIGEKSERYKPFLLRNNAKVYFIVDQLLYVRNR